jgi:hypothetical protein
MSDLYSVPFDEIRSVCKLRLESLEQWLRRLVNETLIEAYGSQFISALHSNGEQVIPEELAGLVIDRQLKDVERYPRPVDAMMLSEVVGVICQKRLFDRHFREALSLAFPNGRKEALTFLQRLVPIRNKLAHAGAIGVREAEQVMCYSGDVIDSLKQYYRNMGAGMEYDAPLILSVADSFGKIYMRNQFANLFDGGICMSFKDKPENYLRPGEKLCIEVNVDESYGADTYDVLWFFNRKNTPAVQGRRLELIVTSAHIGLQFDVMCKVTASREWHRMASGMDDLLHLYYKVLPS